jgi:5-(aminomethyl)-3-furanmethanol phosphate kinase
MSRSLAVVKVGGSLYDWPDLGQRLRDWLWLQRAPWRDVLLIPGGGPTADVIREFDRIHQLGEKKAHWLALAALRLNAWFLAEMLPLVGIIGTWEELSSEVSDSDRTLIRASILDPRSFACWDARAHPDTGPPPCWAVTSDSIAARAAVVYDADYLILLKSVTIPADISWEQAGERGFVDEWFARTVRPALPRLKVRAVNFREWRP